MKSETKLVLTEGMKLLGTLAWAAFALGMAGAFLMSSPSFMGSLGASFIGMMIMLCRPDCLSDHEGTNE